MRPLHIFVPLAMVGAASAQVNAFSNGSFENGNAGLQTSSRLTELNLTFPFDPVHGNGVADEWLFNADASLLIGTTTDGNRGALLDPGGSIRQGFKLNADSPLLIDFDSFGAAFVSPGPSVTEYDVRVIIADVSSSGTTTVFNAIVTGAYDGFASSHSLLTPSLPAGEYQIGIAQESAAFVIDGVGVTAAPEPSSALLSFVALGAAAFRRRR